MKSFLLSILSKQFVEKIALHTGKLRRRFHRFDPKKYVSITDYVHFVETWWDNLSEKEPNESLLTLSGEKFDSFDSGQSINEDRKSSFLWGTTLENRHNFILRSQQITFSSWGQAFIGKDGRLISELSAWFHSDQDPHGLAQFLAAKPISTGKILGSTLFLTAPASGGNYFHWLLDVIPRFYLLKCAGIDINKFDHILFNANNKSFQREFIRRLELPENRILTLNEVSVVRTKYGCATSRPLFRNGIPPKWSVAYLRDLFASEISTEKSDRRIFILRENSGKRFLVDQDKIMVKLAELGFEGVRPENYTVAEQARLFASAEVVIGVHGAGLTNLVFSRPQCKVLEILPADSKLGCYWWIAGWNNLAYHYLVAENVDHGKDSPLRIGIDKFIRSVEELISAR